MNTSKIMNEKIAKAKSLLEEIKNLDLAGTALTDVTCYVMQMLNASTKSGILGHCEEL